MNTNAQTAKNTMNKTNQDATFAANESGKSTNTKSPIEQAKTEIKDPYVAGMLRQKEILILLLKYEVLPEKVKFYEEQLAWIERSLAMVTLP